MSSNRVQHQGNSRHSVIVPYRIGLLLDRTDQAHRDLHDALLLGIDETRASGELDRDVIVEVREAAGAPNGSVLDVVEEWRAMTADGMLMAMVGPFVDDNGAALAEDIDAAGLPTLTYSPDDQFGGKDIFQFPFGHAADSIHRLLAHALETGAERITLVHEPTPRGVEVERQFRLAAWQRRATLVDTIARDARLATELKRLTPDAVIYLGDWNHEAIDSAIAEAGIAPLRLTGTEIVRAHAVFGQAIAVEGWTGLALIDPTNRVFRRFEQAFHERYGRNADHAFAAFGYDVGRLLGLVLAVVRPPSPLGVRAGLDKVRMIPSAVGAAGTVISFARYDHRGYKGDPMILSVVRDGKTVAVTANAKVV